MPAAERARGRRYLACFVAAVATVACGAMAVGTIGSPVARSHAGKGALRTLDESTRRLFSRRSFWNSPVARSAQIDPSSAAVVAAFAKEAVGRGEINTTSYSVPIYTVPATQPSVRVTLVDPWRAPGATALQQAWSNVPLPPGAEPAGGTDKQLVVYQPQTDRLWEFWRLNHAPGGWRAAWGGAIQHVSTNAGVYGPEAWPGATRLWGASATSLSIAGGLITLGDLARGRIDHALAMGIFNPRFGAFASPAQRTDGASVSPLALPEGAHLRLNPSLDLAKMHLPRITRILAEAAQRYGIYVRDTVSGDVVFYAQDPAPTGLEPYAGPTGLFEGMSPREFLGAFPWNHLQLLKMELHPSTR